MTTVIINACENKIVADRQTTSSKLDFSLTSIFLGLGHEELDWTFKIDHNNKIMKINDGKYLVGSGNRSEIIRQYNYVIDHDFIDKPKSNVNIAIVSKKGDGLFVDLYKAVKTWSGYKFKKSYIHGEDFIITFGSGGDYAYGAIKAGVSSEEALIVASKCDIYTSSEYDVVEL